MKELVSDDLIRKAKGKFRLSVLLQKRMREYFMLRSGGAEPPLERALAEFRKGDIHLEEPDLPEEGEEEAVEEEEQS